MCPDCGVPLETYSVGSETFGKMSRCLKCGGYFKELPLGQPEPAHFSNAVHCNEKLLGERYYAM